MTQLISNHRFLKNFSKESNGLYKVYERFTFDEIFCALLEKGLDCEEALCFILANCSLSALVFQQRIHNKYYLKLSDC